MNHFNKKLTVLLPLGKLDQFVGPAVECIINQTYTDFICYVLCDESLSNRYEDLKEIFKNDLRFKLIFLKLGGIAFALNYGINLSTSEYIARMDADDLCPVDRFEQQINFLDENLEFGIVGSKVLMIDESGSVLNRDFKFYESNEEIRAALKYRMPLCHPGLMFRRDLLLSLKGYAYGHTSEDHELFLRVARLTGYKFYNIPDLIFYYRRHTFQLSTSKVASSAFKHISGFLFTEFLYAKNPKYILGMIACHPSMRSLRALYRKIISKI
jgi:O86/O127-antigen biosynthesis beta-1,3-galactosyltransferase